MVQASANILRLDHVPVTGAQRGYLFEAGATNLLQHSVASVSNRSSAGGILTNLTLGALGLFQGVSIASLGAKSDRMHPPIISLAANVSYTISVLFRSGTSTTGRSVPRNKAAGLNSMIAGDIGDFIPAGLYTGGLNQKKFQTFADGTHYFKAEFTPSRTDDYLIGFGPHSSTSGEDIAILGMQVEVGTAGTSFIETGASTATRAADVAGTEGLLGVFDVTIVYDDNSTDTLTAQSITDGYWPTLSRPHVTSITATPV
jgi:hypothetical protein